MKYCEEFVITSHDVDYNGLARPSVVWRYMQETANHQMRDEKPSYMDLYNQGMAFIVSRICVKFFKPLHAYEKIRVETWACESKGASFNRSYQLLRDGEIVAEGYSICALVNRETKRLYRVNEIELHYSSDKELIIDLPIRFRISQEEELVEVGEREIRYSDVDCNGHMNNTNYLNILNDFLPEVDKTWISGACINFSAEAPLNGKIKVFRSKDKQLNGNYYFRTIRDDRINIEAFVETEPIK